MRAWVCWHQPPAAFDTRLRRWYTPADGSVKFDVGVVLQGDVLMRCRHKRRGGKKSVAMFRAAFHTGYTPELVLRFSLAQLEGTSAARYPDDFFVELIFAPVDASGDSLAMHPELAPALKQALASKGLADHLTAMRLDDRAPRAALPRL